MMLNEEKLRERYSAGAVETEAKNEIRLEELNFEKCVVGSDEAGMGEVFKPMVTVAAYAGPENRDRLMKLCVQDSKAYTEGKSLEKAKEELYSTGKTLTGFDTYQDFEGKEGKVIRTDYATFAVSVLLNSEFNKEFKPRSGKKPGNYHELQRQEHKTALLTLAKDVPYDYMVIDDFQGVYHHDKILKEIDMPTGQAVIVTHADSQVMAVACASVIACYLANLYVDALDKMLKSKYGISEPLPRGPVKYKGYEGEKTKAPLKKLKEKTSKEEYEAFLVKYAKKEYIAKLELDD